MRHNSNVLAVHMAIDVVKAYGLVEVKLVFRQG